MKKFSRFVSTCLLPLFFLMGSSVALATDTDGDGVPNVAAPIQVSAGNVHACALGGTGVHCWGNNSYGQTNVPALVNPVSVSAGLNFNCALDDNGVHCWGQNGDGQTNVPVLVNPVAVSAGGWYACALDDNGVHCWGADDDGQITGQPALVNPVAVTAGRNHVCAIDDSGMHCWGANSSGQSTVPPLANPVMMSLGFQHTCALDDTGMHCWGSNSDGQSTVPSLVNPVASSAAFYNTCAIDDSGLHCWGSDSNAQLTLPVLVNPVAVTVGFNFICAVDDTGVHCWGSNSSGQTSVPALMPFAQDNCPLVANADQLDMDDDGIGDACDPDVDGDGINAVPLIVSAGGYDTCAIDETGVQCWGNYLSTVVQPTLVNPVAMSTGFLYTCAIDDNGVQCWGYDSNGQTVVPTLVNPMAVSAGEAHVCALDDTGVTCWGRNDYGETIAPTLVNPVAVSAGGRHSCALDDTGVHCWGNNLQGQTTVPTLVNPVAVSAGYSHTCAIDDTGVKCWGDNTSGQLNNLPTLVNPVALSAGAYHTCAIDDTGLRCWGSNSQGQRTVPTLVNPVAVTTGYRHTCAIDDAGVHCWGAGITNTEIGFEYGQSIVPALSSGDNCPLVANADQLNNDGDAQGDACDTDDDNDGVIDTADEFPFDATESEDTDGDGLGDNSDPIIDDANTLNNYLGSIKTDKAGSSVAFAGDFNGDGYGDYVIGIPGYDLPATPTTKIQKDAGRAVVISGKNGGVLASAAGFTAKGAMGFAVAGNGDINNDGFDDVVVGAPYVLKNSGSVTVLYGPDGGAPDTIFGPQEKALMGSALALTDWNHDNYADVVVGIPKANESLNSIPAAGCVIVVSGNGLSPLLGADFCGTTKNAYFGTSVAVGDFNDDGDPDLVIGAPNDDDVANKLKDTGSVTVYLNAGTALQPKYGATAKALLGTSVASGDVNNDGYDDVLAGAPGDDTPTIPANKKITDTGSVTVFSGNDGSQLTKHYGVIAKAGLGNSVAAGDVNGDDFADIIAGAKLDDKPSLPKIIKDTGSVSVWSGNGYSQIGNSLYGDVTKDAFGTSVSAGDVNGDGKADVMIGIPGFDIPPVPPAKTIKNAGAVKVISGTSLSL